MKKEFALIDERDNESHSAEHHVSAWPFKTAFASPQSGLNNEESPTQHTYPLVPSVSPSSADTEISD